MRVDTVVKNLELTSDINGFIEEKSLRLEKHLKHFSGNPLHLKAALERNVHKEEYQLKFSLSTPAGVLSSHVSSGDLFKGITIAFENLVRQAEKIRTKSLKGSLSNKRQKE